MSAFDWLRINICGFRLLTDLHSANIKQKITKLEPINLPRLPSFSISNSCLQSQKELYSSSFETLHEPRFLKREFIQQVLYSTHYYLDIYQYSRTKYYWKTSPEHLFEVATGGVLYQKVLLEISQNSHENTCARDFFFYPEFTCLQYIL